MEGIRILLLVGTLGGSIAGAFYAGVQTERASAAELQTVLKPEPIVEPIEEDAVEEPVEELVEEPVVEVDPALNMEELVGVEASFDPVLSIEIDLREDAALYPTPDDILLGDGVRIGPMGFDPFEEALELDLQTAETAEQANAARANARRARQRRRAPARPPGPRLHSDPGMHSILTARRMMASGERIQGSCYRYLSEVYERAGHSSWRKRRIVFRGGRNGPYADLNLIRPGDWLYIVNDPHRTPVGTHSVMFVRWTDRARGYASVISHPGWGSPSSGRESTYDIRQTYRIIRPTM